MFTRDGDEWVESAELVPDDQVEGSGFASAFALDGDTALVGSSLCRDPDIRSGAACVFVRRDSAREQQAELVPGTTNRSDDFGTSVDIAQPIAVCRVRCSDSIDASGCSASAATPLATGPHPAGVTRTRRA